MTVKESLKIKEALITLSDYLDMKPNVLASNIIFLDKERQKKMITASKLWNKFDKADIVERGKMLGVEIIIKERSNNSIKHE